MHKSRNFLRICAILTAAGLLLLGTGAAMGGMVHGIQIDAHGLQVYAPLLANENDGSEGSMETSIQKKETLEAFDSILVDMENADIRIEQSDADAYTLSYFVFGEQGFQKEVKDGKLILKHDSHGVLGNFSITWFFMGADDTGADQKEMVTIQLPKGAELSDVQLHTESGDTVCENIRTDRLNITAEYGNVSLLQVHAQHIDTTMESGKLRMEQVQGDSCSVRNDYGSLSLDDLTMASDCRVEMGSGDVRFRNTDIQKLDLESSYGNVAGEQTEFGDLKMNLESGDCEFRNISLDGCEIYSSYGNVELELEKDVAEYEYQLHTEYGSIEIGGKKMGEYYSSLQETQDHQIGIECESGDIRIN